MFPPCFVQAAHSLSAHKRRSTQSAIQMAAQLPPPAFNWDAGSVLRKAHDPAFWQSDAPVPTAPVPAPRRRVRSSVYDETTGYLSTQRAADMQLSSSPSDVLQVCGVVLVALARAPLVLILCDEYEHTQSLIVLFPCYVLCG